MKNISCPWCNCPLPCAESTQVCTACGKTLHSVTPTTSPLAKTSEQDSNVTSNSSYLETQSHPHKVLLSLPNFSLLRNLPRWWSDHRPQKQKPGRIAERTAFSIPLTLDPLDEEQFTDTLQDPTSEENTISQLRPDGQRTWNKVVELSPRRQSYSYPPRPPVPESERVGTQAAHLSQSSSILEVFKHFPLLRMKQTSPKVMFWLSTAILLFIVSLFGITSTFGHGQPSLTNKDTHLSLQITPNELSAGATMTLQGDHFSPHASIGLRRDNVIPLIDTSGAFSTETNMSGYFTDTIIIGDDWGNGSHTITAEDSLTHKVASFPIRVEGEGVVSRPGHLHLSVNTLDFGSGDQATNSTQTLTLFNTESSEISWQADTSKPWLLITPTEGTFTHDMPQQVTVAVDRSKLPLGPHSAKIHFSSDGGNESLAVSAQVTSLQPEHEAIMQISPAVLSFIAADGSNPTSSQQIMVSNSGGQAMSWHVSADVPWLTTSSPSLIVEPGSAALADVSVESDNLLPGTYTGTLTFTAQNSIGDGIVFHSPQQVVVSITVTPPCSLVVTPAMLDFASAYLQPAPSPKTINVTGSTGCTTPLNWNASSSAPWLKLNKTGGATPDTLSIGIDVTGLTPNIYTGTVTLSSGASIQTLTVRFILAATAPSLQVTSPSSININAPGSTSSLITLANTGGSALNWYATLQSGAPPFVALSKSSGSNLAGGATDSFNVVVNANGVASGQYQTSVTINATNAANGQPIAGSPTTIPITITIASPLMQVSQTNLSFSASTGGTTNPQSITITNSGGGTLSWAVSSPTQSWLSVSTTAGKTGMGSSSTLVFSIQTNGLTASSTPYTDQVVITPSVGNAVTINISLTISRFAPKSTATPTPTATANSTPTPTPTVASNSGSTASPTASAVPTPVATSTASPTPTSTYSK
jgi:Viral BACON domain